MCTIVQWYMHCSVHCIVHCIVHCRPVDVTEHARVRPECKWSVLVGSTILVGGLDRGQRWWSEVVVVGKMVGEMMVGKTVITTSAPLCLAEMVVLNHTRLVVKTS